MKKINKKQKLIILVSILTIIVIIGIVIGINVIKSNIANGNYNSSNEDSNNGNLLPEYIKAGITLGGVTGTLEDLDTSDATATPEDILEGKTAYVKGQKITGTMKEIYGLDVLKIGDYVDYKPDPAEDYQLSASASGNSSSQTIYQNDLKWRVMSINDNGTVDLVSEQTALYLYLGGAAGYNNGVFLLNDIAKQLYSNSSLGITARSINIEDIKKGMNEDGLNYVMGGDYGKVYTITSSNSKYYPDLYREENGSGINTTAVKENGIDISDSYYGEPNTASVQYSEASSSLTATYTSIGGSMAENYFKNSDFYFVVCNGNYWIASRFVNNSYSSVIRFGISSFNNGYYIDRSNALFTSHATSRSFGLPLRIVVSLKPGTRLSSGDGQSSDTPYQIVE